MGFYNWFFGQDTTKPKQDESERMSWTTSTVSSEPTEKQRIEKLETLVKNLSRLLKYEGEGSSLKEEPQPNGYIHFVMNYNTRPSIEFPNGIIRSIKKTDATETIDDTKPSKSKAKK